MTAVIHEFGTANTHDRLTWNQVWQRFWLLWSRKESELEGQEIPAKIDQSQSSSDAQNRASVVICRHRWPMEFKCMINHG